jgi:KAP family P-loop domain
VGMPEKVQITKEEINNICEKLNITEYNVNLNRETFINTLSASINTYFTNPQKFEGNIFLVDGAWGVGKSWALQVTKEWIKVQNVFNGDWLEYSAWQYLDEKDLFFDLWKTLNSQFLDKLTLLTDNPRDEIRKQITHHKWWVGGGAKLGDYFVSKAGEALASATLGVPIINPVNLGILQNSSKLVTNMVEESYKNYNHQMANLMLYRDKFYDFDVKKPTIVVVEDLDRIERKKLWRIFSFLSLFEGKGKVLFILVGSSHYLEKIIEDYYHVEGEGENFLAKFISMRFALPAPDFNVLIKAKFQKQDNTFEIDEKILDYCIDNFVHIHSYRELKVNYLETIEKIKESELWKKDSPEKNAITMWIFLMIDLKLHHKDFWKCLLRLDATEFTDHNLIYEIVKYYNSVTKPIKTRLTEDEFNKWVEKLKPQAYLIRFLLDLKPFDAGYKYYSSHPKLILDDANHLMVKVSNSFNNIKTGNDTHVSGRLVQIMQNNDFNVDFRQLAIDYKFNFNNTDIIREICNIIQT